MSVVCCLFRVALRVVALLGKHTISIVGIYIRFHVRVRVTGLRLRLGSGSGLELESKVKVRVKSRVVVVKGSYKM